MKSLHDPPISIPVYYSSLEKKKYIEFMEGSLKKERIGNIKKIGLKKVLKGDDHDNVNQEGDKEHYGSLTEGGGHVTFNSHHQTIR